MNKRIKCLFVLSLLALGGCSTNPFIVTFNEDQMFTTKPGTMYREIVWVAVTHAELQDKCKAAGGAHMNPFHVYLGCAVNTRQKCTIYTATDTKHQLLGHEVRHCFHGNFHK
jgi:hypothetical protein